MSLYALLTVLKLAIVPLVVYVLCLAADSITPRPSPRSCAPPCRPQRALTCSPSEYDVEKSVVGAVISMTTLFSIVTLLAWLYIL